MSVRLQSLLRCMQGVVPATIATCSADGTPNVTFLSQIYYLDEKHVALSRQFFNKTQRNIDENPHVFVQMYDPITLEAFHMRLRFDRSETSGPLFDSMSLRIQAIASHTGMSGIFRLLSADIFEVHAVEKLEGFLQPAIEECDVKGALPPNAPGEPMTELRGLQLISQRINRPRDLDGVLRETLQALDDVFRFRHAMVLLLDETGKRLVTIASHGYGEQGIGAEVAVGDGLIGAVARERRLLRLEGTDSQLRYGRAIRHEVQRAGAKTPLAAEIPLAGLADAQAHLALPLIVQDRLLGVLAVESHDPHRFQEWHEAFLQIIANQIAMAIDNMLVADDDDAIAVTAPAPVPAEPPAAPAPCCPTRTFQFFRNDDCVFVDGEYLIRNVPGKILWKILTSRTRDGRREFTNRELRLDPNLGLPPIKDNLESRLILLRKRLAQKCPDVQLVPVSRGRFRLVLDCELQLVERESG